MFLNCIALTSVSTLDTISGRVFNAMFQGCTSLLTAPQMALGNGVAFTGMFANCTSLNGFDNFLKITDRAVLINNMFFNCTLLSSVVKITFDTVNVTDFTGMFGDCVALTAGPIIDLGVGIANGMFSNCNAMLTSGAFNGTKSISYVGCTVLTGIEQDVIFNALAASNPAAEIIYLQGTPGLADDSIAIGKGYVVNRSTSVPPTIFIAAT
jgi:hypothetical protein